MHPKKHDFVDTQFIHEYERAKKLVWVAVDKHLPVAFTISQIFTFRSANTMLWIFPTVSGAATSIGPPDRLTSVELLQPQRNSVNRCFNIELDAAECPQFYQTYPWLE